MILKDWVTLIIALYGAGLSTFNAIQTRRKDNRSVSISLGTAMYTYANGTLGDPMHSLEIINKGHRDVVVNLPSISFKDNNHMALAGADNVRDFPKKLQDGEAISVRIPYSDLADAMAQAGYKGKVKIFPKVTDQTGGVYIGKGSEFDVDEYKTKYFGRQ